MVFNGDFIMELFYHFLIINWVSEDYTAFYKVQLLFLILRQIFYQK